MKQWISVLLIFALALSLVSCKKKPTQTESGASAPMSTATSEASSTPKPITTVKPSPSPSQAPAQVQNFNGTYAKNAGSGSEIWLTVSDSEKTGFSFVLEAKGVIVEGKATFTADGTASYNISGMLIFSKTPDGISVQEKSQMTANVSFDGNYQWQSD